MNFYRFELGFKNQSSIIPLIKCYLTRVAIAKSPITNSIRNYLDTIPKIDCPSIILRMSCCPVSVILVSSISIPSMART